MYAVRHAVSVWLLIQYKQKNLTILHLLSSCQGYDINKGTSSNFIAYVMLGLLYKQDDSEELPVAATLNYWKCMQLT